MPRKSTALPLAYWSNAFELGALMAEAQAVIAMRLLGMAGFWSVTPQEDARMVSEKIEALTRSGTDAATVALAGGRPDQIVAAAIRPIRRKTRANFKRLGRRQLRG